jgi:acetyl-CoA carboxylase carboxyl transferase subunit beta
VNWITNYVRPKINSMLGRREVPENLWIKCPETGEMVYHRDLEENKWVIPQSGFHMKMPAKARLKDLFDGGIYEALPQPKVAQDPLKFRDSKKYSDRLRDSRAKTELEDTIVAGVGRVQGVKLVGVVHEFNFIGGSLGMAAGEAIVKAFEKAIAEKCPLVIFPASGGARMQEGILSLMQLPRTTVAVNMLKEAGLPYIVVLTNLLRHAWRCPSGRTRRRNRLCRQARDRADPARKAAGRLPDRGIPAGARHGRHGGQAS